MDSQNTVFRQWFDEYLGDDGPKGLIGNIDKLLTRTYDVTRAQVGGLEVVQSLRAVAPLQDVRLSSHRLMAAQFATTVASLLERNEDEQIRMQSRLSIDAGYAIVEMALEDESLSADTLLREGARMIQLYWQDIVISV